MAIDSIGSAGFGQTGIESLVRSARSVGLQAQESAQAAVSSFSTQSIVQQSSQNTTSISAIKPVVPTDFFKIEESRAPEAPEPVQIDDAGEKAGALIRLNQAVEKVAGFLGEDSQRPADEADNTDALKETVEVFESVDVIA